MPSGIKLPSCGDKPWVIRGTCGVERVGRAAAVPVLDIYIGKVGREKLINTDSVPVDGMTILINSNVTRQLERLDIDTEG